MKKIMYKIVERRKVILIIFLALVILCGWLSTKVKVNYNLQDYLSEDVPSTIGLHELEKSYEFSIPNARAVFSADSVSEALTIKGKLQATEGVKQVLWLDDFIDLSKPLELQDKDTVENFYKDGKALFQLITETEYAKEIARRIYNLDENVMVSGQLIDLSSAQTSVQSEIYKITLFVVPFVLLVLALSTHSWLEPIIFAVTIGVGIALNMGTNIFLGSISFITQAIAAILQLAVSMDYTIFLLNRFNANRKLGHTPEMAMAEAMHQAAAAISSSALTTLFGFLALVFMRFGIGSDLGIVMGKGIFFSFLSVMVFMPCLLLIVYKLVDKTTHKNFLPDFRFLGKFVHKVKIPLIVLAVILAVPGFLGSRSNTFIYGMGGYPRKSKMMQDSMQIKEEFGRRQQMSLLVPKGDVTKELKVTRELENNPEIISVMNYVNTVDKAIPPEVIDADQLSMLLSDKYSQFIITADVESEGDQAFRLVEAIRQLAEREYGDQYHLIGANPSMYDMKTTIEQDNIIVNGLAVLAITLVILFVFRSLSIPVLLVLTIEIAIWINLSIPYFIGTSLSYIGYLIVSTVQLGATVDYAILFTEHYLENRRILGKNEAVIQSIRESVPSLLPPALILTITGFVLNFISSLTIVSELGLVLGRGAFLSLIMVVFVLPALLYFFDTVIQKTTIGLSFVNYKERKQVHEKL